MPGQKLPKIHTLMAKLILIVKPITKNKLTLKYRHDHQSFTGLEASARVHTILRPGGVRTEKVFAHFKVNFFTFSRSDEQDFQDLILSIAKKIILNIQSVSDTLYHGIGFLLWSLFQNVFICSLQLKTPIWSFYLDHTRKDHLTL